MRHDDEKEVGANDETREREAWKPKDLSALSQPEHFLLEPYFIPIRTEHSHSYALLPARVPLRQAAGASMPASPHSPIVLADLSRTGLHPGAQSQCCDHQTVLHCHLGHC